MQQIPQELNVLQPQGIICIETKHGCKRLPHCWSDIPLGGHFAYDGRDRVARSQAWNEKIYCNSYPDSTNVEQKAADEVSHLVAPSSIRGRLPQSSRAYLPYHIIV